MYFRFRRSQSCLRDQNPSQVEGVAQLGVLVRRVRLANFLVRVLRLARLVVIAKTKCRNRWLAHEAPNDLHQQFLLACEQRPDFATAE